MAGVTGASSTLRLHVPLGKTLVVALLLLASLVACAEALARQEAVAARLPAPGYGGNHDHLGIKLARLDGLMAHGGVECIFVGSSMVMWGMEPEQFSAGYERQAGQPLPCFNFGLMGFTASEVGPWAEILARRYQPRFLIFGTSARDYSATTGGEVLGLDVDIPWGRYQLGEFSAEGWLTDHSAAYRTYQTLRIWPLPDYRDRMARRREFEAQMTAYGFNPVTGVYPVHEPPNVEEYRLIYEALAGYAVSEDDLAGLRHLLSLQDAYGVTVIVAEMPVPATYMDFFAHPAEEYGGFLDAARSATGEYGVLFVGAPPADAIPANGWSDYGHLNLYGAEAFSAWLGAQVGAAARSSPSDDR